MGRSQSKSKLSCRVRLNTLDEKGLIVSRVGNIEYHDQSPIIGVVLFHESEAACLLLFLHQFLL